jgi:magnesium transporter
MLTVMTEPLDEPDQAPAAGEPDTPGPPAPTVTKAQPPTCPTRTRAYRDGKVISEGFPAEQISDLLAEHEDTTIWLDLRDPDLHDLQIVVQEFGLHPLAVEDAVQDHQRPKLDHYESHLFVNSYAVKLEPDNGELGVSEVSAFVTRRALITVRKDDVFDIDTVVTRWDAVPEIAGHGVGFLLHGFLDVIVDGHVDALQILDDALEELEEQLFSPRLSKDIRRRGFDLRKSLVGLRRVVVPMRDLVASLVHKETRLVDPTMAPYYQDVYDHVLRAADWIDGLRDLVGNILDSHRNEQSYQLNEVTKKLAGWAAIIAVPTAITGFYGQNVPYPGFAHHSGFIVSSLMIIVLAGGLFLLLRRRDWL